jgi:hypothetical protein
MSSAELCIGKFLLAIGLMSLISDKINQPSGLFCCPSIAYDSLNQRPRSTLAQWALQKG